MLYRCAETKEVLWALSCWRLLPRGKQSLLTRPLSMEVPLDALDLKFNPDCLLVSHLTVASGSPYHLDSPRPAAHACARCSRITMQFPYFMSHHLSKLNRQNGIFTAPSVREGNKADTSQIFHCKMWVSNVLASVLLLISGYLQN